MFGSGIDFKLAKAKASSWSNPFTPDIARLEKYQRQLLFVTDEWMSDRNQSMVLRDEPDMAKYECAAFTMHKYRFLTYKGILEPEPTPVVLQGWDGCKIKGEIVSIRPRLFLKLDKLKLNGVKFERRRVHLIRPYRDGPIVFENTLEDKASATYLPNGIVVRDGKFPQGHPLSGKKVWYGPEKIAIIRAWMYIGKSTYWDWIVKNNPASFNEVERFAPKNDKRWLSEYYKYQNESS